MFYVVKEVKRVDRAVNDATLNQAGNVYQYLVALKDCYELAPCFFSYFFKVLI